MSTHAVVPGPRSGLDEGSLHDLCVDGAQVELPHQVAPHGEPHEGTSPAVVVPDDARHLLDDLPPYGT
jgi:hypothetical protein